MVQRLIFTKIEHYHEARWWNEVFEFAENYLEVGTFKGINRNHYC
jgi:malate synthase